MRSRCWLACLCLILICLPVSSQTNSGRISGTVSDASGAPVPECLVTLRASGESGIVLDASSHRIITDKQLSRIALNDRPTIVSDSGRSGHQSRSVQPGAAVERAGDQRHPQRLHVLHRRRRGKPGHRRQHQHEFELARTCCGPITTSRVRHEINFLREDNTMRRRVFVGSAFAGLGTTGLRAKPKASAGDIPLLAISWNA